MRASFTRPTRRTACSLLLSAVVAALCLLTAGGARALAQQTNPVDRKVTNPITDTPNLNPLQQDQPPIRPRRRVPQTNADGTPLPETMDELDVRADRESVSGPEGARVVVHEGNVDARIGIYRLQADKVTVYPATN